MDLDDIAYTDEFVLVVDDEDYIREPIVEMLRRMGFRVDSANNGKHALKKLKKKPYTFLLTDMRMPEMDGLELIQKAKNDYPNVSTVAMTGYSKEYDYVDVVNAGAADFINKPFGIEELEAKVRRAIIERNIKNELNKLSITDSLTGLYNQRHFYTRLQDEITRAERQKHPLGLILLDLDNFKNYNDTHGHIAGDELLQKTGEIINLKIRQGVDSGYRYGGDEFAVILIDADEGIGKVIGQRIEQGIQEKCNLGASLGYAYFSEGMTMKAFVETADKQLYKVKKQRNNKKK
jgi:two-component system cell cycle response regulator